MLPAGTRAAEPAHKAAAAAQVPSPPAPAGAGPKPLVAAAAVPEPLPPVLAGQQHQAQQARPKVCSQALEEAREQAADADHFPLVRHRVGGGGSLGGR